MHIRVLVSCSTRSMEQLISGDTSESRSSGTGLPQCEWYEAPVSRAGRQLYQPVCSLARHWVLSGRRFGLSDIAEVLLGNATTLLVSSLFIVTVVFNVCEIFTIASTLVTIGMLYFTLPYRYSGLVV